MNVYPDEFKRTKQKTTKRRIMQNALINNKIYFFTTKEELELATERDNIIDKMIAIQNKNRGAWLNSGKWSDLQYDLMDIENKLKKTCSYLNREDSKVFENGGAITEAQIIKQDEVYT